ncbi:MAG: hypothetical protein R6V85_16445 [Polyangia bacterium]
MDLLVHAGLSELLENSLELALARFDRAVELGKREADQLIASDPDKYVKLEDFDTWLAKQRCALADECPDLGTEACDDCDQHPRMNWVGLYTHWELRPFFRAVGNKAITLRAADGARGGADEAQGGAGVPDGPGTAALEERSSSMSRDARGHHANAMRRVLCLHVGDQTGIVREEPALTLEEHVHDVRETRVISQYSLQVGDHLGLLPSDNAVPYETRHEKDSVPVFHSCIRWEGIEQGLGECNQGIRHLRQVVPSPATESAECCS